MATRTETLPEAIPSAEEKIFIASQWKLVWWRFLRHRLAVFSVFVLAILYLIALSPEFLATHDPQVAFAKRAFVPPQRVHFFNGLVPTRPYVNGLSGKRNPVTLGMEYTPDLESKIPIDFFVSGFEYKIFNLIKSDTHLMGLNVDESKEPMPIYLLGTDRMGRDMFSRLMIATRISMSIGLVGVALNVFLGVLLGGISGYRGGVADLLIQRLIEFLRAMPTIPLWLALAASVPSSWSQIQLFFAITIIISLIGWTRLAREVRGRFLAMREEDFVVAARLYGSSQLRIIFRHMLPSFASHIIATTTLAIPAIIIAETALSFLGIGLRQPTISWGVLLYEAQNLQAVANAPWLLIPGLFVLIAVLGFNFMGDGLRDAADPYSNKK
jgi:peptide/nickel transport system permease protein